MGIVTSATDKYPKCIDECTRCAQICNTCAAECKKWQAFNANAAKQPVVFLTAGFFVLNRGQLRVDLSSI